MVAEIVDGEVRLSPRSTKPHAAASPRTAILGQVARGVAIRMAVLYLFGGGEPSPEA
jgi:aspartate carbamoyltransferase catalytic subunit